MELSLDDFFFFKDYEQKERQTETLATYWEN
jgi:hypothetical protein